MKRINLLLLALMALLLLSCDGNPAQNQDGYGYLNDYGYPLVHVPYEKLFKNRERLFNTNNDTPQDEDGVLLFQYAGGLYYHPVNLSFKSLEALNDYYITNDQVYIQHAIKTMEALRREATRIGDKIYFSYKFNFSEGTMVYYTAPWYSGMAQGTALSAYCRLYHFTQEPLYKAVADSILNTMTDFSGSIKPVLISDQNSLLKSANYYWVDEYPHHIKRYVLNGGIIGAMGLYDHWWVFGDDHSRRWFSRMMTSVKDNVLLYRNPGGPSAYDLKYRAPNTTYHEVHQQLLRSCSAMTNDDFFAAIADLFYADYH